MARPPASKPELPAAAQVESASAWYRPTTLAPFFTSIAALLTAAYPIWKDSQQRSEGVLGTQDGRVSALTFGCSSPVEVWR